VSNRIEQFCSVSWVWCRAVLGLCRWIFTDPTCVGLHWQGVAKSCSLKHLSVEHSIIGDDLVEGTSR